MVQKVLLFMWEGSHFLFLRSIVGMYMNFVVSPYGRDDRGEYEIKKLFLHQSILLQNHINFLTSLTHFMNIPKTRLNTIP